MKVRGSETHSHPQEVFDSGRHKEKPKGKFRGTAIVGGSENGAEPIPKTCSIKSNFCISRASIDFIPIPMSAEVAVVDLSKGSD